MAAVLRVKRKNDEEPWEALVLACKRRKTEESEVEEADHPVTAVLKFAGTVKNQADNIVEHLTKNLSKEELKANFKKHVVDVVEKARQQTKQDSQESRYKVVNHSRSLDTSKIQELDDKVMTLIDVEDSTSCTTSQDTETKVDDYVYDLYYTQTGDDVLIDHLASVHPLQQELVFDSYRDCGGDPQEEYESEDSNSESNWKNDYPDSDHSEGSIGEEDMRNAVKNMKVEDGSDLSSDNDFVYAIDESDVDHYGSKYAKYKARMNAEVGEEESDEDSDAIGDIDDYGQDESDVD